VVPASKIKAFLADREFIGKEWFRFLSDRDVPFCIRVKKDTTVEAGSGTWGPAWWLFEDLPVMTATHGTIRAPSKECRVSRQEGLHLVGTRYVGREGKAEYLLLLTNSDPEEAIHRYRRRWEIETLFGALKSRGSRLEATHLRAPGRIRKLIALLSLAFIWAHLVGLWRQERDGPLRLGKPWALGEECFPIWPGPPSPIAAPCGHRGERLRALSQAPTRASASFVGYIAHRLWCRRKLT
jgi:hypothetical protein